MSTAPTVESCRALGQVTGEALANRMISAEHAPRMQRIVEGRKTPEDLALEKEGRLREHFEKTEIHWQEIGIAESRPTLVDLACRGAGLAEQQAFAEGHRDGFRSTFSAYCEAIHQASNAIDAESTAPPPNRKARLKAKALARKAPAP